ncbi:MAG: dihydrolipoyl dehydrogenase [Candidatus Omnitrophota bacterium]
MALSIMYDLAIVGAGWAGFNAALRAKELSLQSCLIDSEALGGVCLNQGCIPTKTFIQSAKVYSLVKKASLFGVESKEATFDLNKLIERKEKIIQQLSAGMRFSLKGVDLISARAGILSVNQIQAGDKIIQAKNIIIATGSLPMELPQLKFDHKKIISSTELLNLKDIPETLLVIGGGVIGCEFASLFSGLGSKVTLVEKCAQLLPGFDADISRKLENVFKKRGIEVKTNSEVSESDTADFTLSLLCVGRAPNPGDLGLEKIGVKLDRNTVVVNDYLATSVENIYAAGDCTGKLMLAHYAAYQGKLAVDNIMGKKIKADNAVVPNCIFTDPQVSGVGLSQAEAQAKGLNIKISKFDFLGSGAARILDEADGFIKVISDKDTGCLLGASIIGPQACELSAVFGVAISAHLNTEGLRKMIFAHPTLSESVQDSLKS